MAIFFKFDPLKWALLLALFIVSTSTATFAAQAVSSQGPKLTQGWVTGVHRANGQLSFRIRTAGGAHRIGVAANQNGGTSAGQNSRNFIAGPNTRFEAAQGANVMPAGFASLRSGQRVMIESHGSQATRVRIFTQSAYTGRGRSVHGVRNASGSHHVHHQGAYHQGARHHGTTGRTATNISSTRNFQSSKTASAAHHVGHKSSGGGHGK